MKYFNRISCVFNSFSDAKFNIIFVSLIFLTCLVRCFHGIDMTDSGWVLSGYQQIFEHPSSVESMFYIYDTLLIGGMWEKCFGFLGIIGYKILSALFITILVTIVYVLLRKIVNKWLILFCSILLITTNRYLVFHYDVASAFFSLIIVYFIYQALIAKKEWLILIAGILLGISVFVRFPNISLAGLILILIPFYVETKNIILTLRLLLFAVGGFIVGFIFNVLLLVMLGHMDSMVHMCSITFSFLSTSDSTHNLPEMLHTYKTSYVHVFKSMCLLTFIPFVCYFIDRYEVKKWIKVSLLLLFNIIFLLIVCKSYSITIIHALCCLVFSLVFIQRDNYDINTIYLVVLSFLIMAFFPIGSDGGIYNVGINCLFLSFPLAIGLVWNNIVRHNSLCNKLSQITVVCILTLLLLSTAYRSMHNSYRDTGSILKKTEKINNAGIYTVYTNPEKAAALDSLLAHVSPYIKPETELLAYPSIPMVNYLTHTKPYLNGAWIGILNLATFEQNLWQAEENKQLPIVVIAKAPDINWYVPNAKWLSISDCEDWHPSIKEKNELLSSFLLRHSYEIIYNNELFQVLIPVL